MKNEFTRPIITKVLPFEALRLNEQNYLDYDYKDPAKPFCVNIVNPKLKIILEKFAEHIASERQSHFSSL